MCTQMGVLLIHLSQTRTFYRSRSQSFEIFFQRHTVHVFSFSLMRFFFPPLIWSEKCRIDGIQIGEFPTINWYHQTKKKRKILRIPSSMYEYNNRAEILARSYRTVQMLELISILCTNTSYFIEMRIKQVKPKLMRKSLIQKFHPAYKSEFFSFNQTMLHL